MKTQARLCDMTETMDRILRTGRTGEWAFRAPHCGGTARVVRGGAFEVSPDFRNLLILAGKLELTGEPCSFGRLTIFSPESDETLYLHCASLITAEPETISGRLSSSLVSGGTPKKHPAEPLAVLIARVYCVELKVPSHAISVLARSDVPKGFPLMGLSYSLGHVGSDGGGRSDRPF